MFYFYLFSLKVQYIDQNTLSYLNSIFGANNQLCVLGATNEHNEALCDVSIYVSVSLKVSVNCSQTLRVFFLVITIP